MPPIIYTMWDSLQLALEGVGMLGASVLVMTLGVTVLFVGLRRP